MRFPETYPFLECNRFQQGNNKIVPIRYEDRLEIMKWRNEQIYHLRQKEPLTKDKQEAYFRDIIADLFVQEQPNQILFSYLEGEKCIGYGGLVHINWSDKNAELSFVINTDFEKDYFYFHWSTYLYLIEQVAFEELNFHKIYTYAFDLRPQLYEAIENAGFKREATLKEHCFFEKKYTDVVIHSKINDYVLKVAEKHDAELLFYWANDEDVRNNSFNSQPILWKDHLVWLNGKLSSENTRMYILYYKKTPIGQIRFDRNQIEQWVIDYSIGIKFRGKGFGRKIINMGLKKFKNGNFVGLVKNTNLASFKTFEKIGFDSEKASNFETKFILLK